MFLLFAMGAAGSWCAHQHWMQLDARDAHWRRRFWSWAAQGAAFPILLWALINLGVSARVPALDPALAELQASGGKWFGLWWDVTWGGVSAILACWAAVTYGWIFAVLLHQTPVRSEVAITAIGMTLFTIGPAYGFAALGGVQALGGAALIVLLPAVYCTISLGEKAAVKPIYARAISHIKRGKYTEAEWEVISQLENAENDFEGWMMLAELYAVQFKNLEDAARVVLDICKHPESQPVQISVACHKLADWQVEVASNPEGARAALELLCRKLPGTHFARMAQQRIRQLPRDEQELSESRNPRRITLPILREEATGEVQAAATALEKADALKEVNRLTERLTENTNDIPAREKLALLLGNRLGKVALGIEQLRLLIELREPSDEQKAKWLAQIASWEFRTTGDRTRHREALRALVRDYPNTSQAFAAQRRIFLLEGEEMEKAASERPELKLPKMPTVPKAAETGA